MRCIITLIFPILLASCGRAKNSFTRKDNLKFAKKIHKNFSPIDEIKRQEAKLTDIPIPVASKPIKEYCSSENGTIILGYHSSVSIEDLISFYQHEMERFGWEYGAQLKGNEVLLNFEKPNRVCSISIRPYIHQNDIVIFTGLKDPDLN